jgi:hypothetical protein
MAYQGMGRGGQDKVGGEGSRRGQQEEGGGGAWNETRHYSWQCK